MMTPWACAAAVAEGSMTQAVGAVEEPASAKDSVRISLYRVTLLVEMLTSTAMPETLWNMVARSGRAVVVTPPKLGTRATGTC